MPRIIIADSSTPAHAEGIKAAISGGYGSDISADIEIYPWDLAPSIAYARSVGAIAVVHSYVGVENHIVDAEAGYPELQCFMPLGSNSHVELTALQSVPIIITCGAGIEQNDTAYGMGLEFWDAPDLVSSNSNGTICGKLLRVRDSLLCTWWEARYRARMTASGHGAWDKFNGYGVIDIAGAIGFGGQISPDPYRSSVSDSLVLVRLRALDLARAAFEALSFE